MLYCVNNLVSGGDMNPISPRRYATKKSDYTFVIILGRSNKARGVGVVYFSSRRRYYYGSES